MKKSVLTLLLTAATVWAAAATDEKTVAVELWGGEISTTAQPCPNPNAKNLLFGICPSGVQAEHSFSKPIAEVNEIICKPADDQNVFYCGITDKMLDKKGVLSCSIMPDLLPPNDVGYEIWSQAVMPYTEKFAGKK